MIIATWYEDYFLQWASILRILRVSSARKHQIHIATVGFAGKMAKFTCPRYDIFEGIAKTQFMTFVRLIFLQQFRQDKKKEDTFHYLFNIFEH